MRYSAIFLLSVLATALFAQNTNVEHRSTLTYSGQVLANVWGYAAGGHEYALVGAQNGLSIVDVTDPDNPDEIIQISGPSSSWREIKTYQNYAYVVSEGGGGVQVVNLSNLPNTNLSWYSYFGNGAINGQLTKAHALHVDVTKGYLYVFGSYLTGSNGGKALIFNLNADPYNPSYVGTYNSTFQGNHNYIHDGYVDNDVMYGSHIYGGFFSIVNTANKSNPSLVATRQTPGLFTHNTWRSGNTIFTTDEVSNSFLAAYDISNPSNITQVDKIQSNPGTNSTVHNTYILNDFAITSWYRDGFTIVDVARPGNMIQVGNYDTYPNGSGPGFSGCWGVYPYLPSGNILASNIAAQGTSNGELWVMTPTYERGCYVEGQITNAATGFPLSGALVKLLGTGTSELSAATGLYKMGQLQSGTFAAQVSKLGFVTYTANVSLNNGELTTLNVALAPIGLPVEITRFTAEVDGRDALLHWETASEVDNAGFEVQHSVHINTWKASGFVPGKGSAAAGAEYEFRVPKLPPGTHFFRLRQIDVDGKNTFTEAEVLEIKGKTFYAALRPNALHDAGELYFFTENATSVRVEIFDAAGRPVDVVRVFDLEHEASLPVEVGHLPSGLYFATVQTETDRVVVQFVKM